MMNYENAGVTYQVRKYMDGETQKMDVTVPTYTLDNTVMGNMTLGTYTIKGLTYDEAKGGFYRDYKDDGLKFHVVCEGGSMNMDNDYSFNAEKDNNILVKYEGSKVSDIINRFQMGAMPFYISTNFKAVTNGIGAVKGETAKGKEKIAATCDKVGFKNYKMFETLRDAVVYCKENAQPGDAVLLSPACASWDMFDSYEQRGELFKKYVKSEK